MRNRTSIKNKFYPINQASYTVEFNSKKLGIMEGFSLPNYYAKICAVSIYSNNVILHKSELFNQDDWSFSYGKKPNKIELASVEKSAN